MGNHPQHRDVNIPNVDSSGHSSSVSDTSSAGNHLPEDPFANIEPEAMLVIAEYLRQNNYDQSAALLRDKASRIVTTSEMQEIGDRAVNEIIRLFDAWFDEDSIMKHPSTSARHAARGVILQSMLEYGKRIEARNNALK